MLRIHHLGHSQSERVVWLCEELGLDYELRHYTRDAVTILSPPELKALHPLGAAPLIEDGSVKSDPTTLVNAGLYYRTGPARIGLDVFNLFDAKDADITYFYESRLPGEPAPVEDRHIHPVEPRQLRASVRIAF